MTFNSSPLIFISPNPILTMLKGTSGRKKKLSSNDSVKNAKQRAVTDLNSPNGSRDIPFQSQEFEQYGCRHFGDF